MASISSPGLGSGLDVNGLVQQLVALESRPLAALDRKEAGLQAELSAYGSLKGALSGFKSSLAGLMSPATFQTLKATSADTGVYTASASSSAVPGQYAVEVKQLAQAQKLASKPFSSTSETLGTGTITIQFGTYSGGVFTANASKAAQAITIDSAHSTLGGVRDAINAANAGVSASILNDGTGDKLVLSSKETGAENSLKITVSGDSVGTDVDDTGLSQLAYDPSGSLDNGKNLSQTVAAQNAVLKVDGIDNINKATNTVTDVIQGVTLNLVKQSDSGVATNLTVTRDSSGVKSAVQAFVKAYNDVDKTIRDLTAYDPKTKTAAILQGDASTLSIMPRLRNELAAPIAGLTGAYTNLSQIGVSFQADGTLAIDNAKLTKALTEHPDDIVGLFAANGRPSSNLITYLGATDATGAGRHSVNVSSLASQGYLNGASTATLAHTDGNFTVPFAVDANNDAFSVKIDGVQAGTISLAQGNYTTGAALAAEIQSKINGDSALKAATVTVTVSFDSANSRFVVTSDRYGSASKVEVTSTDATTTATLGLSAVAGTDGADVAGSIGGVAAIGSGRRLTGASSTSAEGLKLEITGMASGSYVDFSRGYAWQLDDLLGQLLDDTGPIDSRTDGIDRSIKDISEQRERMTQRLEDVEARLRAQFVALDMLMSKMRTTSDFLTQQLSALPRS